MSNDSPFISVIIPTYARPRQLAECLQALTEQDYPRDRFEVIVVDDGSPEPLETAVLPYRAALNLTLLRQDNAGPGIARNTGAEQARGELLAFTDDDCRPAPNWLRALAAGFQEAPEEALGGRTLNALPHVAGSTASQMLLEYVYHYYGRKGGPGRFFASNNLAFPTKHFRELGGFDTVFLRTASEDREICARWQQQGRSLRYLPDAVIYHAHYLPLTRFWQQHFNYGRGAYGFRQVCRRAQQPPVRMEPPGFYIGMLLYPVRRLRGPRGVWIAALVGLSQAASLIGYFSEKWQLCRASRVSRELSVV